MNSTRLSLLQRMRGGENADSWDEFYSLYGPYLLRYAMSCGLAEVDARDVVQDVFVRLWRVLDRFQYDPTRARFRTWLRRVATNSVRDWLRSARRRSERFVDADGYDLPDPRDREFNWDLEHQRQVVRWALEAVREESRALTWTCFQLHCLEGRTADEVAKLTGLTTNGVYINAARTMARVRERCARCEELLEKSAHDPHPTALS